MPSLDHRPSKSVSFRSIGPQVIVIAAVILTKLFETLDYVRTIRAELEYQHPLVGVGPGLEAYACAVGAVPCQIPQFGSPPKEPSEQRFSSLVDHHPLAYF